MLLVFTALAKLLTGLLLGGMSLFAFGFAVFILKALPTDLARSLIRKAFPPYYLLVIVNSLLAGLVAFQVDRVSGVLLAMIGVTTLFARQMVMPAVNAATDRGDRRGFGLLHGVSVMLQIGQIVGTALVLLRL